MITPPVNRHEGRADDGLAPPAAREETTIRHLNREPAVRMEDESSSRRQKILLGAAVGIFVIAGIVAWLLIGGDSPARRASDRIFVCSETGKPFEYTIKPGDVEPVYSPHSKQNTGYQAEPCYWTKGPDGEWKAKLEPTWVLVKKRVDPETTEKTYCPDCGHEVTIHNQRPPQELMDAAAAEAGK